MFLSQDRFHPFEVPSVSSEEKKSILSLANFISIFRASAPVDSYTGELRGFVQKEEPTRTFQMLSKLYKSLIAISSDRERSFALIKKVAKSSVDPHRLKIFSEFRNNSDEGITISQMQKRTNLGLKTCKTELFVLKALGFLDYYEVETNYRPSYSFFLTNLGEKWLKRIEGL